MVVAISSTIPVPRVHTQTGFPKLNSNRSSYRIVIINDQMPYRLQYFFCYFIQTFMCRYSNNKLYYFYATVTIMLIS